MAKKKGDAGYVPPKRGGGKKRVGKLNYEEIPRRKKITKKPTRRLPSNKTRTTSKTTYKPM